MPLRLYSPKQLGHKQKECFNLVRKLLNLITKQNNLYKLQLDVESKYNDLANLINNRLILQQLKILKEIENLFEETSRMINTLEKAFLKINNISAIILHKRRTTK